MRRRTAEISILAVGEGKSELIWLSYLKTLYLLRGCGTTLKVKGGFGKGGKGVLDYAISISRHEDYSKRILLLDTDKDWNAVERERAKSEGFDVIESTPCLEATLLAIQGDHGIRNSSECKRAFEKRFSMSTHDERMQQTYQNHFPRHLLDERRAQVRALGDLLQLLGV